MLINLSFQEVWKIKTYPCLDEQSQLVSECANGEPWSNRIFIDIVIQLIKNSSS